MGPGPGPSFDFWCFANSLPIDRRRFERYCYCIVGEWVGDPRGRLIPWHVLPATDPATPVTSEPRLEYPWGMLFWRWAAVRAGCETAHPGAPFGSKTCAGGSGASDLGRPWVGIAWAGRPGSHGEVVWGGRRGRAAHPLVGDIRMSRGCIFDYTPPGGGFWPMRSGPYAFKWVLLL